MNDAISAYCAVTELTPLKFTVTDAKTGEVGETDQNTNVRKAALDRAHEIRQFEIELYWKRATYFWILQAAVFAAVGLVWRSGSANLPALVPVALAALGTITSLAGWLSAKGSKFWQENWEHHIDMLEDEFEGRLHKTAYIGSSGIAWSVSGVNERLAAYFAVFWFAILSIASVDANAQWKTWLTANFADDSLLMAATLLIWIITVAGAVILISRRTDFSHAKGIPYDEDVPTNVSTGLIEVSKLHSVKKLAKLGKPFLVRREPKI